MSRHAGPRAAALAAVLLAVAAPGAVAQEGVGLQITPAQVEPAAPLDDRRFSGTLVYTNHDDVAYRVDLSVTELGHDLDGTPGFIASVKHARAFSASPTSFEIGAGERRDVTVRGRIPAGDRSIYVGVVAAFAPGDGGTTTTVEQRSRIAAQYLLRGPRPWTERVRVVEVGVLPGGGDALRVYAALENTGNVHVKPRGTIEIRKNGVLLDEVELEGGGEDRVLPRYKRRLSGLWTPPPGLDGRVTLTARIRDPSALGEGTVDFTSGRTVARSAEIRNLVARDSHGALVTLDLVNTGPAPLEPSIELTATEGETQRARRVVAFDRPLEPGEARPVEWRPALANGTYTIVARARAGDALLDEAATGLVLGAPGAPGTRGGGGLLRWLALLLIVLVVGLILYLLWRRSRRRGDDRAAPPQVPTRTAAR